MIKEKMIYGIHAVREALQVGTDFDKIYIRKGSQSDEFREIRERARRMGVPVFEVPVERLNRFTRGTHQGVVAIIAPISYTRLDLLIASLFDEGKMPFIVVLDGITDVRNFGAIARSCECAGVDAIVIPDKGSVSVTADAVNASVGALLRIPVCRERNLAATCRFLSESGLSIVGASEKSSVAYTQPSYQDPVAIVMGSEYDGISLPVQKQLSQAVAIPQMGEIGSLNVSVACGIMLYEVVRQRQL